MDSPTFSHDLSQDTPVINHTSVRQLRLLDDEEAKDCPSGLINGSPCIQQPRTSTDYVEMSSGGAGTSSYQRTGGLAVATVEGTWSASNISRYVPLRGLDFLLTVDYVYIQQTIELLDLLASVESENRYLIKDRNGETLFVAAETSDSLQRQCCGSGRSFSMRLFDMNRQETLVVERPLAASMCCCPCCLQLVDIQTSNGKLLGRIQQEWTLFVPEFVVLNALGHEIFKLQGPNICGCFMYRESNFKVIARDGYTHLGSISHSWDDFLHSYTMAITFPANVEVETKALLIGAAFLLEYMFFEKAKTRTWQRFLRLRI